MNLPSRPQEAPAGVHSRPHAPGKREGVSGSVQGKPRSTHLKPVKNRMRPTVQCVATFGIMSLQALGGWFDGTCGDQRTEKQTQPLP